VGVGVGRLRSASAVDAPPPRRVAEGLERPDTRSCHTDAPAPRCVQTHARGPRVAGGRPQLSQRDARLSFGADGDGDLAEENAKLQEENTAGGLRHLESPPPSLPNGSVRHRAGSQAAGMTLHEGRRGRGDSGLQKAGGRLPARSAPLAPQEGEQGGAAAGGEPARRFLFQPGPVDPPVRPRCCVARLPVGHQQGPGPEPEGRPKAEPGDGRRPPAGSPPSLVAGEKGAGGADSAEFNGRPEQSGGVGGSA